MKPVDVQLGICIKYGVEHNGEVFNFKVGDHVRLSKYKNIFAKGYTLNWFEEIFVVKKKKKKVVPQTFVISDFNSE